MASIRVTFPPLLSWESAVFSRISGTVYMQRCVFRNSWRTSVCQCYCMLLGCWLISTLATLHIIRNNTLSVPITQRDSHRKSNDPCLQVSQCLVVFDAVFRCELPVKLYHPLQDLYIIDHLHPLDVLRTFLGLSQDPCLTVYAGLSFSRFEWVFSSGSSLTRSYRKFRDFHMISGLCLSLASHLVLSKFAFFNYFQSCTWGCSIDRLTRLRDV